MGATHPSQAKRTTGETVGLASCAAWWASEIADRRRRNVEMARCPAWSTRYSRTVSGSAGIATSPRRTHHASNCRRSLR
jgi:hypothetical protein